MDMRQVPPLLLLLPQQVASNATVLQTISNQDGTVSIVQLDPSTAPGTIIQLPDGTTAQVAAASTETAATGVHTLAEVATAVSAQNQQQQQVKSQIQSNRRERSGAGKFSPLIQTYVSTTILFPT